MQEQERATSARQRRASRRADTGTDATRRRPRHRPAAPPPADAAALRTPTATAGRARPASRSLPSSPRSPASSASSAGSLLLGSGGFIGARPAAAPSAGSRHWSEPSDRLRRGDPRSRIRLGSLGPPAVGLDPWRRPPGGHHRPRPLPADQRQHRRRSSRSPSPERSPTTSSDRRSRRRSAAT